MWRSTMACVNQKGAWRHVRKIQVWCLQLHGVIDDTWTTVTKVTKVE